MIGSEFELFEVKVHLDGWFILAAASIAVGAFVRGFAGFGSALIIIPALAHIFGPREAVAMHAIMEIPVILGLLPAAVRNAEARTIGPMLIALVVTTPIGAIALKWSDADLLKLAISLVVLLMVILLAAERNVAIKVARGGATVAGAAGGLIQGATGIGGPPVVVALMARHDPTATARGNVIAVMSSMIAISIVAFALYGLLPTRVLVVGALAAPICLGATWLGSVTFKHYGDAGHRPVVLAVLALTAVATLATSLAETL